MNKLAYLLMLLLTGCASAPCKKYETINQVGWCHSGRYTGLTCTAITESGLTVRDDRPFTQGQLYCTDW